MAKLVDPAEKNEIAEEFGGYEDSATGAGIQNSTIKNNEFLIVGAILAFLIFS